MTGPAYMQFGVDYGRAFPRVRWLPEIERFVREGDVQPFGRDLRDFDQHLSCDLIVNPAKKRA